jgi:hypothetical protein
MGRATPYYAAPLKVVHHLLIIMARFRLRLLRSAASELKHYTTPYCEVKHSRKIFWYHHTMLLYATRTVFNTVKTNENYQKSGYFYCLHKKLKIEILKSSFFAVTARRLTVR